MSVSFWLYILPILAFFSGFAVMALDFVFWHVFFKTFNELFDWRIGL